MKSAYNDVQPFVTRDGSYIRELMHPDVQGKTGFGVSNQSLAEAVVAPGKSTILHRHHQTEELYFVNEGQGLMTLADEQFEVEAGDTVCITPGTPHCIENIGSGELKILCCCSPAYSHDDTELLA